MPVHFGGCRLEKVGGEYSMVCKSKCGWVSGIVSAEWRLYWVLARGAHMILYSSIPGRDCVLLSWRSINRRNAEVRATVQMRSVGCPGCVMPDLSPCLWNKRRKEIMRLWEQKRVLWHTRWGCPGSTVHLQISAVYTWISDHGELSASPSMGLATKFGHPACHPDWYSKTGRWRGWLECRPLGIAAS